MDGKDYYLLAYNAACFSGWLAILVLALQAVFEGLTVHNDGFLSSLANVYATPQLGTLLAYSQSAALLEIVHAAIGFVRAPVVVVAMQVSSRIFALFAVTYSTDAQGKSEIERAKAQLVS
jgi:hypothetical protein